MTIESPRRAVGSATSRAGPRRLPPNPSPTGISRRMIRVVSSPANEPAQRALESAANEAQDTVKLAGFHVQPQCEMLSGSFQKLPAHSLKAASDRGPMHAVQRAQSVDAEAVDHMLAK